MKIDNFVQFMAYPSLEVTPKSKNNKNVVISFFSENCVLPNAIKDNISLQNMGILKYIFLPGKGFLMNFDYNEYKRNILLYGYKMIRGSYMDVSEIKNRNYMIDNSELIRNFIERYNITNYRTEKFSYIMNTVLNKLNNINSESYEKVLLYHVNLDKPFEEMMNKRIFFIINNYLVSNPNSMNKMFLLISSPSSGYTKFVEIYNDIKPYNEKRVKNIMMSLKKINSKNENFYEDEKNNKE